MIFRRWPHLRFGEQCHWTSENSSKYFEKINENFNCRPGIDNFNENFAIFQNLLTFLEMFGKFVQKFRCMHLLSFWGQRPEASDFILNRPKINGNLLFENFHYSQKSFSEENLKNNFDGLFKIFSKSKINSEI